MKKLEVEYVTKSSHKHSVRFTPKSEGEMKLPDVYVTKDVLTYLNVTDTLTITFSTK